jgi:signal transduction histidine kinase
VNLKHDNLQSLLAYIRNYITSFFESTTIETGICFPEEVPFVIVSPDIKHNLFLVIREALNNIVKHAGATKMDICFKYTGNTYTLTIADNGQGMEAIKGSLAIHS